MGIYMVYMFADPRFCIRGARIRSLQHQFLMIEVIIDPDTKILKNVITGDESYVSGYDVPTKV